MITPMVARLVRDRFDREGWLFELKWDGFRTIAETDGTDGVKLYSRNQSDFKKRFPPIADALAAGERWPNAFFAKQGLFSLKHAHEAPSASKVTCHRKSYTSNHRGEAVPDSPRMQAGHQRASRAPHEARWLWKNPLPPPPSRLPAQYDDSVI